MSARLFGAALGILCLAASGCLGRSPSVRLFALHAVEASETRGGVGPANGLAVGLGPISLPRYLDRPQLVRRSRENVIDYDEYRRWASPLDVELLGVLGENVAALLPSDRVVVYPRAETFPLAVRVILEVQRFEAMANDVVTLRARWTILKDPGRTPVKVGRIDLEEALHSSAPVDVVAAHSALVGVWSRAIADDLRDLPIDPDGSEASSP